MAIFTSAFWSVSLPQMWEGHNDPECATFTSAQGIGTLQISSARKDDEVTDEDLLDLARGHLSDGAKTRNVAVGDFKGFTFAYGDGESFWREWFLRRGGLAVFATYNCPATHMHQQDPAVETIISRLQSRV